MAKRKTFDVAYFRDTINNQLKLDSLNQDEKKALCVTVEFVLLATGNYKGFRYNYSENPDNYNPDLEYDRMYYA